MSRSLGILVALTSIGVSLIDWHRVCASDRSLPPANYEAADDREGDSLDEPPRLVIDEIEIDAGEIPRGGTAKYAFIVNNRGAGRLEINVKPRCGCTIVDYDQTIPPGGHTRIDAELRTAKYSGTIRKRIEVTSNDPAQPRLELVMIARLVSVVEVQATGRPRMMLKMDEPTVQQLTLRTRSDDVEVTKATCGAEHAQVALDAIDDDDPGRAYRLTITVLPEAPPGRSTLHVELTTTAELEPQVPISVQCEKGIVVSPPQLLTRPSGDRAPPRAVLLRKPQGGFHIVKATSSDPSLEVHIVAIREGSLYRLTTTQHGELAVSRAKIIVETDDPQQPLVEIPVRSVSRRRAPVAASPDDLLPGRSSS